MSDLYCQMLRNICSVERITLSDGVEVFTGHSYSKKWLRMAPEFCDALRQPALVTLWEGNAITAEWLKRFVTVKRFSQS